MPELIDAVLSNFSYLVDVVLHLDEHMESIVVTYDTTTYLILALIVFCETGLIVTPILPGDSLLFAAGAVIAKTGALSFFPLTCLLFFAALLGDHVNYAVGRYFGRRAVAHPLIARFAKPEYLMRTEKFFERFGPKAIVLARFMPIVRTFAPFTAGLAKMPYPRYVFFCITGGLLWVNLLTGAGYLFGDLPVVKENFELVVLGIVGISVLPVAVEIVRARLCKPNPLAETKTCTSSRSPL